MRQHVAFILWQFNNPYKLSLITPTNQSPFFQFHSPVTFVFTCPLLILNISLFISFSLFFFSSKYYFSIKQITYLFFPFHKQKIKTNFHKPFSLSGSQALLTLRQTFLTDPFPLSRRTLTVHSLSHKELSPTPSLSHVELLSPAPSLSHEELLSPAVHATLSLSLAEEIFAPPSRSPSASLYSKVFSPFSVLMPCNFGD